MQNLGINTSIVAEKMNWSNVNAQRPIQNDNIKLAQMQEITKAFGYEYKVWFEVPGIDKIFTADVIGRLNNEDVAKEMTPRRMNFLRAAMLQQGMTAKSLSEIIPVSMTGITGWFKTDDILMSKIYMIENATGWVFHDKFVKIKD